MMKIEFIFVFASPNVYLANKVLPEFIKVKAYQCNTQGNKPLWQHVNGTDKKWCVALVLRKFLASFTTVQTNPDTKEFGCPKVCLISCDKDEFFIPLVGSTHVPDIRVVRDKVDEIIRCLSPNDIMFASVECSSVQSVEGTDVNLEQALSPIKLTHLDIEFAYAVGKMPAKK